MSTERVQKILAQAGIASRRKAEELIREGAVTINGKVAQLGDKANFSEDAIKVNGKLLHTTEAPTYVLLNKPKGVICAMVDPEGRPTLSDLLGNVKLRLYPVGRLDFNSEGLILLTNDGAFAEKMQKNDQVPRTYLVKVKGAPEPGAIERLEKGGKVEHTLIKPFRVRVAEKLASKSMIEIVLVGAGAMDIKTLFELKGFLVERVVRTHIGHLTLHGLPSGRYKFLKASQTEALLNQPELAFRLLEHEASKKPKDRSEKAEKSDESPRASGPKAGRGIVIKPLSTPRPAADASFSERGDRTGGGWGRGEGRGPRAPREGGRAPRFGGRSDRGDRPRFGGRSDREDRPRFGGRSDRGDGPRFGGRADRDGAPRSGGFSKAPRGNFGRDREEGGESGGWGKPRGFGKSEGFSKSEGGYKKSGGFSKGSWGDSVGGGFRKSEGFKKPGGFNKRGSSFGSRAGSEGGFGPARSSAASGFSDEGRPTYSTGRRKIVKTY